MLEGRREEWGGGQRKRKVGDKREERREVEEGESHFCSPIEVFL